jgi:hypothetical protein
VDTELHHELHPRGIAHYRREAKALLRDVRRRDPDALRRAREALGARLDERFVLADALHVIALEHGHRSWPAFKRAAELATGEVRVVGRIGALPASEYATWADVLIAAARRGEESAVERLRARVPRLRDADDAAVAARATVADARVCLAHEYGFRTWDELAAAADRAHDTHYSRLPAESAWKRAEAAIQAHDAERLRSLLEQHPGLELEDPGGTLLGAAAQPEAGPVPREVIDLLIEAGSELDVPLNVAACFDKVELVGWLLDAGADPAATHIWGITPLQSAVYHGSRYAADVLVERTGLLPDALYISAGAGAMDRLAEWFDATGALRPEALRQRPNLSDVGWPPQPPPSDDPADALAEALSLAALSGRTAACRLLVEHGADPGRAPLYGMTPLEWAQRSPAGEDRELVAILS